MPFDLDWKADDLADDLTEPFHQANEVLGREFAKEITSRKWQWPSTPTPRDIVDTGELRRSYVSERTRERGNPAHDHSWNVEYALAVHQGAVFAHGGSMPARPWTKQPLDRDTLQKAFERLAKRKFGP